MFNNSNANGDAFETPARQTLSTVVTAGGAGGRGGVLDFFATQDDGFADGGCSFQLSNPQEGRNQSTNPGVGGGMRSNNNNMMSLMGLTSTPQMTPGADDPHRSFRDAFAAGNRYEDTNNNNNNVSQSGAVTSQEGVPPRAVSVDGECLFPTAITNHYGGQQQPPIRAIPTHNPILAVSKVPSLPPPPLPNNNNFNPQQQQQHQQRPSSSFPTNVANGAVTAANVHTNENTVSHRVHPTHLSPVTANSAMANTNGYGASYLARQQNQKQSQHGHGTAPAPTAAGQSNTNDARFGSYLRFLTTTSHQMPSASYYQEVPIVVETASKPVATAASAGGPGNGSRSTAVVAAAAVAPLSFHKQLEVQLHEHKMKEIRHIQNQIGGIGVGGVGVGGSGALSPNATTALPQLVNTSASRKEKGSTSHVVGSQIAASSSPPSASQPLQSTTNALYLQYATAAAASAGAPLYAGHEGGVGGSDASFSSHRAQSQTPFTQQNAVQAPSDLLTYIRAVRDGSFDQRQKQLQEMQRYGLVSHLHYSYPTSSSGGGGGLHHQSPNNSNAAALAGAGSPNANSMSSSSAYYTSPSSSSAPLSSADVLRRQQEAMERKKAANLQRWLSLGATNVPQQLVAHYKPHLEDIHRQEEERKAKAAAVQQALIAKNPLSFVSLPSQPAPLSSSSPAGSQQQQQQHAYHSDAADNAYSNAVASPVHNLRPYASTTLSAMAASSDTNESSLAAAAGQPQFSSAAVDGASAVPLYVQLAEAERLAKEKQFEKKLSSMAKRTGASKDGEGVEEGDSRGGGHGRGRSAFGRGRGRGGAARVAGKKSSRTTEDGDDDETQDANSEPLRPAGGGGSEGGADQGPTGTGRGKAPGKKKAGGTPKQPAAIKALEALLNSGGGGGAQTAAPARTLLSISGVKGGGMGGNNSLTPSAADLPLPPVEVCSWAEGIHSNENPPPALAKLLKFIGDHNDDPAQMVGAVIAIIAEITSSTSHHQSKQSASATSSSAVASSQETESSFSLCSKHDGKILFTANDSPKIAANLLHKTYVFFKGIVFELDQTTSFCMFNAIFTKDIEVEIVTFHASAILIPLLSYHGGSAFSANNVNDLRTMAWMLNPNNHCPCFDSLQLSHNHNATFFPSSSRSGIIQRLPVVMDLYQKMYGGLGHTGLLQPYMRQEKSMGLLCCIMKYNGFCVRTDLADSARASAERQMDEMKEKAVQFIRANCPHFFSPGGGADGGDDGRTGEFNIQSTKDLQSVLFTYMGLDKYLYTPGGSIISPKFITGGGKYSTSEEVLRHLSKHEHTFVPLVMNYRKLAKLTQTYFNGVLAKENLFPFYDDADVNSMVALAAAVRTEDGSTGGASKGAGTVAAGSSSTLCCVHANFNQGTTDTGRLSCVDPNIQNLPRCVDQQQQKPQQQQSLLGPLVPSPASPSAVCVVADEDCPLDMALATAVRTSFVARPGHSLVAVDYEQIELRVLAHLSHDPKLLKVLCSDDAAEKDIHKRIAAEVFCKPIANISTEERTQAKRVVFGTLYGAGPGAFAAELGITEDRARAIQNFFWRAFPSVERYQRDVLNKCRQTREVRTIVGRLRKIPDIVDAPYGSPARSAAERQAFNTCVQGSAADIVKKAMAHVFTEVLCKNYAAVVPDRNSTALSGEEVDGAAMDGRPLLLCQIHDELIFSVPNRYLSKIVPDIRKAMVNCFALLVPLKVSVKYGSSLGTLRDWSVDGDIGLFDAV